MHTDAHAQACTLKLIAHISWSCSIQTYRIISKSGDINDWLGGLQTTGVNFQWAGVAHCLCWFMEHTNKGQQHNEPNEGNWFPNHLT